MEEKTILRCKHKSCNMRAKSAWYDEIIRCCFRIFYHQSSLFVVLCSSNVMCYKCCIKNLKKICPLHQEELRRKQGLYKCHLCNLHLYFIKVDRPLITTTFVCVRPNSIPNHIEEDRYVQEALDKSNANNKVKRLFRHEEVKFTDFNQTVVIW